MRSAASVTLTGECQLKGDGSAHTVAEEAKRPAVAVIEQPDQRGDDGVNAGKWCVSQAILPGWELDRPHFNAVRLECASPLEVTGRTAACVGEAIQCELRVRLWPRHAEPGTRRPAHDSNAERSKRVVRQRR